MLEFRYLRCKLLVLKIQNMAGKAMTPSQYYIHNTRVNKIERTLQCTMADNLISIYLQFLNDLQVTLKRQKMNSNNKCIE